MVVADDAEAIQTGAHLRTPVRPVAHALLRATEARRDDRNRRPAPPVDRDLLLCSLAHRVVDRVVEADRPPGLPGACARLDVRWLRVVAARGERAEGTRRGACAVLDGDPVEVLLARDELPQRQLELLVAGPRRVSGCERAELATSAIFGDDGGGESVRVDGKPHLSLPPHLGGHRARRGGGLGDRRDRIRLEPRDDVGSDAAHSRVHARRVRPRTACAEADDADLEREIEAVIDKEWPAAVSLTRVDSAGEVSGTEHRPLHELTAVGVRAGLVGKDRDRRLEEEVRAFAVLGCRPPADDHRRSSRCCKGRIGCVRDSDGRRVDALGQAQERPVVTPVDARIVRARVVVVRVDEVARRRLRQVGEADEQGEVGLDERVAVLVENAMRGSEHPALADQRAAARPDEVGAVIDLEIHGVRPVARARRVASDDLRDSLETRGSSSRCECARVHLSTRCGCLGEDSSGERDDEKHDDTGPEVHLIRT